MKKIFVLSTLTFFAMICSCQKQDSAAEQQLAQRKIELDTRENALAERESALSEREKALDAREKALATREKAMATGRVKPADVRPQGAIRDAADANAERESKIQQIPPEMLPLILRTPPDTSQEKTEKDRMARERRGQRQGGPEGLQSQKQYKLQQSQKALTSGAAASPATAATSPPSLAVYPQAEASSPSPSPATEATSPSPSPTPQ